MDINGFLTLKTLNLILKKKKKLIKTGARAYIVNNSKPTKDNSIRAILLTRKVQ